MEEKYFLRAVYMLDVVPLIDFDKNINLDRELSRNLINILEVFKKCTYTMWMWITIESMTITKQKISLY